MTTSGKARIVICAAIAGIAIAWINLGVWVLAQQHPPIGETRGIEFKNQETVDAVQDLKISDLQLSVNMHSVILAELEGDRNRLMGSVVMVGGIFVIIQIMQLVQLRKKP